MAKETRLRAAEAAELIGVSLRTLANWRWAGKGPTFTKDHPNAPTPVYYTRSAVEAWKAERARRQAEIAKLRRF